MAGGRLIRFCTYEHEDNGYEPAVMTEAEFNEPDGRAMIEDSAAYVWQFAATAEQALEQHNDKHDLWAQRQEEGLPDLHTY